MALVLAILAVCVSVAMALVTGVVLKRYREGVQAGEKTLQGVRSEWESFSSQSRQASNQLSERLEQVEAEAGDRIERLDQATSDLERRLALFHDNAVDTRERLNRVNDLLAETQGQLERFEQYTKDFLERELSQSFTRFDQTVGTVLGEMKNELLRGVERIDHIQSVVENKADAENRLFASDSGIRMLGETEEDPSDPEVPTEPEQDLAFEEPEDDEDEEEDDIVQPGFMEPTEVCETSPDSPDADAAAPQEPVGEELGGEADAPVETPPGQAAESSVDLTFDGDEEETVDLRPSEGEEPTGDVSEPSLETDRIGGGAEEAGTDIEDAGEEARPFEPAPTEAEGLARSVAATFARSARVRLPGPLGESRLLRTPLARSGPAALKRLMQRR